MYQWQNTHPELSIQKVRKLAGPDMLDVSLDFLAFED